MVVILWSVVGKLTKSCFWRLAEVGTKTKCVDKMTPQNSLVEWFNERGKGWNYHPLIKFSGYASVQINLSFLGISESAISGEMDAIFGRVGFRFRHSIADSIMMWILHSAMDKAHEKVQSKEGVIGRLHEISKFYELALMQLDGCLKFVQEETDSSLESSDEEVIGDLADIRDRLERRLMESEMAIAEKDRELSKRMDNEVELRQVLDIKQNELDALRVNLDLQRKKSEDLEELVALGILESVEDGKDGEFSGLKYSVEQQVFNIKQKLDPDSDIVNKKINQCFDEVKIEEMRSDIDILKETMDIAFGRMQGAIFQSELEPEEQELEWTIEKDATTILIKGFMGDIQKHFNAEVKSREKEVSNSMSKHLSKLLKEVESLHDELEPLNTFRSNIEEKSCLKARRTSSEGDSCSKMDNSAFHVGQAQASQITKTSDENQDKEDGHLVAKMIKNHESIIRRKSEELSWLKREIVREKGSSQTKSEKDPISPRRRILDMIIKLEKLIWDAKLDVNFGNYEEDNKMKTPPAEKFWPCEKSEQKTQVDTMEDAWDKMNITPIYNTTMDELHNEIRMLQKQKEDKDLQYMVMELTYFALLEGFVHEFCTILCSCDLEIHVREAIHQEFLKEKVIEWDEKLEMDKIQDKIKEEIRSIVISLAMKDLGLNLDTAVLENKEWRHRHDCLEDLILQGKIQEETSGILFKETYKQWNEMIESYEIGNLINEKLHRFANEERSTRNYAITANDIPSNNEMVDVLENFEKQSNYFLLHMSYLLKEDVQMIVLREISNEWKIEMDANNFKNHVREEIYVLVIVEVVKQAYTIYADAEAHSKFRMPLHFLNNNELHRSQEVRGEKPLVWKQGSQIICTRVEEDLTQGSSLELKEYGAHSSLMRMKYRQLNQFKNSNELLSDLKSASNSMCSKVNNALEQLRHSMALVSELSSSSGISTEDTEMVDDQLRCALPCAYKMEPGLQLEEASKVLKLTPSGHSAFTPIAEFTRAIVEFQSKAEKKLKEQILRVEEATRSLDPLAELVGSLKKKELLYKRAFISRSDNLRKAEIEVDLLADQVGVLQDILDQIYMTLHQHSPVLQKYFEVSDILEMIRKELQ